MFHEERRPAALLVLVFLVTLILSLTLDDNTEAGGMPLAIAAAPGHLCDPKAAAAASADLMLTLIRSPVPSLSTEGDENGGEGAPAPGSKTSTSLANQPPAYLAVIRDGN